MMQTSPNGQVRQSAPSESSVLHDALLQLRSNDAGERVGAYNRIRPFTKQEIAAAYYHIRKQNPSPGWELDCLERVEVELPNPPIICERCICTVASPGYERLVEALLDTWLAYGDSPDTPFIVFAIDGSYESLAHRPEITRIRCRSVERLSAAVKGVIYSVARFVQSSYYLTVEADMLVVGGLQTLWAALDVTNPGVLMGVRSMVQAHRGDLDSMISIIGARKSDILAMCDLSSFNCPYWFNGGLIAGGRQAFVSLDAEMMRLAPHSILWMEGGSPVGWNDECLMNLCIGLMNNAGELSTIINQQLFNYEREKWLQTRTTSEGMQYRQEGAASKILHFVSPAREIMWQVQSEIEKHGLI
jgi:hypothetical protein